MPEPPGISLERLLPDQDFRFQVKFDRSSVREYFAPTPAHAEITAQRRRWLQLAPQTYAALLPEGVPLLEETIDLARAEKTVDSTALAASDGTSAWDRCLGLGMAWEPDFLLLQTQSDDRIRLLAACVCFPSSWRLEEKIGRPIEAIHGVVPGLNAAIGPQIHAFLAKLRPGTAWLRTNWGLSRSADLNQHPSRNIVPLDETVGPDEIWLRVEHQALAALPRTGGILFGIRIVNYSLRELLHDPVISSRLARALKTMPPEMVMYKNIARARDRVCQILES
jgi:hypothetical protein